MQVSAAATTKDYWGWYQGQWTYIRTWGNRDQSNTNINNKCAAVPARRCSVLLLFYAVSHVRCVLRCLSFLVTGLLWRVPLAF